jgi:hypothetical protein
VRLAASLILTFASSAVCQNTVSVALNYNFNGVVHAGEAAQPDAPNGFRSISDRALDFTAGVPVDPVLARFALVSAPGVLDMVHLGNRDTVDNGNWSFETTANGNNIGTQPLWLANPNQSGPQATVIANPVPLGVNSSASVLFHVSNGGGSCDVTFTYFSGQTSVHTMTAPDWFGGAYAGSDSVDQANPGGSLGLTEFVIDLSSYAGEAVSQIAFSNPSNGNAGYGIYGVNIEAEVVPQAVQAIPLQYNWNGIVHAGEDQQPDAPSGYRSIADRGLDFISGVPNHALLSSFELVDAPLVLDVVMLGNRNTVSAGSVAFDAAPDGDDIGTQPSWLSNADLTGPQTTVLPQPILLDSSSSASVLFQMTNGGGVFDVTFAFTTGSVTVSMRGSDWLGGSFASTGNVDRALPGSPLRIDSDTVDLSLLAGFVLTSITFSNLSNPNGSLAILAANVSGCLACATPATVSNLGGGDGPTIQTLSTGNLGCLLDWTVTGATPSTPLGLWAVGLGAAPLPLSVVFAPCASTLHVVNPTIVSATVDGLGVTSLSLPLVTDPAVCGSTVTAQYAELQAAPCPLRLSDALAITVGN